MRITKFLFKTLLLSLVFISCTDTSDDDGSIDGELSFREGILISGEGSGAGSGSVSFLSDDFTVLSNQIYYSINNEQLGTYLQSLAFDDERAFITVDNAGTITVVDRGTFEEVAKIQEGLELPRYMTVVDGIGYTTNWGSTASETDDFIAVIDLDTYTVTKTISVGNGPERIISKNGKLYVSHKGAYGSNNIISVIDIATEAVSEIIVGDKPDEIFFDQSDVLWVLSAGNPSWSATETNGSITKIDISDNSILSSFDFLDTEHPDLMVISDEVVYYVLNNHVYQMSTSASELPTTSIIETIGYTYSLAVRNDQLFSIDASFTSLSKLSVYDLDSKEKTNSFNIALGGSKIYFN